MKNKVDDSLILADCVKSAQSGDQEAISILIEKTQNRLFRFCVYLSSDPTLAEDIAQETYINVLKNISKLNDPLKFQSWLFKAAKNLYIDHLRSSKNNLQMPLDGIRDMPGRGWDISQLNIEIQQVLQQLTEEDRLVIILIDIEEYSALEAAEIIGVSESALRSRLHRAREAFLKKYEKA